ncbi:uncharacterized protein LOC130987994 [Salvia miltiorrhiza]|uniref:uncharacterized protein LOC130987994 n=1 Tax=Salvia miltiorrhiza TaxID=226208 RepID=UPI0025ABDE95|nr:uncharacterized protein LOC130987994 [Salvia miltiorrhiza]
MALPFSSENARNAFKLLLFLGLSTYFIFVALPNHYPNSKFFSLRAPVPEPPTNLNHVIFGLLGSENAWHDRQHYTQSWWRPNVTRGVLYLDKAPTGDLVPWSPASPPYRVSDDLTKLLQETGAGYPIMIRMVHGIMEVVREMGDANVRWVVMGDDDSVFFVDNMIDALGELDHRKYYYVGGQSEFVMSNYWFSFNQGFGGAGFMLSYPLAKALANDMESCLRRYAQLNSADTITMTCIADIGVNLSPHKGIHQIDLHGDLSGFLSSHPKSPLLSLHHLHTVEPIFPGMDRFQSTRHLMKAAAADQSRMLQQTICHHRQSKWSLSVSWGYSAHIYEQIMPRSHLQKPLETFQPWSGMPLSPPLYMFDTRLPSNDSCLVPHIFYFKKVDKVSKGILTTYSRVAPRGIPPCFLTADLVSEIRVLSPATKRKEMDRCECCDVVGVGEYVELKLRECMVNEVIA